MPVGIIQKGIGGFYYVITPDCVYECKARGVFRKNGMTPLPGDRVVISEIDSDKKTGVITEILERESELVRPAVANVNQLVAVVAVKSPDPDYYLVDKLLITAEYKRMRALVCVNKIDLDNENLRYEIRGGYEKAGYKVIFTSSCTGEGFDQLKEELKDRISVFAGQSGVGKSTILNKILNSQIMKTGVVSEKIKRGKHTTRHAEIVKLEQGGFVVDTPGFSMFEINDIQHKELNLYYPEFNRYPESCKFVGCSHISEPGCCVKAALGKGLIDPGRYERYVDLYKDLASRKQWD
ncbi:MAG TPA: ribosome small subunit-dependent GTPase A [Clostridiaceae bacterium]|nr:ribosome small subunit-dependent GTPase A [Clostridiaceae bacterium]